MAETRLYRVILQIALTVEGDEDTYWPDIEDEVRDRRSWEYDLVRPGWDPDIVSALVLDDEAAHIDGLRSPEGRVGQEDTALRRGGGSQPAPPGLIDGSGGTE